MAEAEKKVEAVEEVENTETTEETVEAPKEATKENEAPRENLIEFGGKVAPASEVLKPGKGVETDVNPLDGNVIAKDSPFNPTKGI